jgi:propanol-preferring alcohol dehydrogenase
MKAMVLHRITGIETAPLRFEANWPEPIPGPGEVRLRVRACAICRTDLHVIEGDLPQAKLPIIPGHQAVGVVDVLGRDCRRLKVGQRIGVAWLRHTCGVCRFCRSGRENLCLAPRFTGYHADGGYAEFAVVPEEFAYELPETFSDSDAAPLLCAGIIGYRALERSQLPAHGKLCLYGFGSSAHVVIQIAQSRGNVVYVVTRGEKHRQLAREMGAAWVGETAAELPDVVDSAILFAPAGELVPAALERLDWGGTLAVAGIHLSDIPVLNYERHLFHERNLHSVTANTRDDGRRLLAEAAEIPLRPHVTHYRLEQANQALLDLKADRIQGTGVLLVGD